jgi:hypothetical protein
MSVHVGNDRLDRPRIGRKARREGLVETIAQERHRLAESLANAPGIGRTEPDQLGHRETGNEPPPDHALELRLARAEAELAAERVKVELLQRHLDDVRRMLPPPDAKPRRRWWLF